MRTVSVLLAMVLLIVAVSLSACQPTTGDSGLSGAAVNPAQPQPGTGNSGTPAPAAKGGEKAAADAAGIVDNVCVLAQNSPLAEVKLDEVNASPSAIEEIKAKLEDLVAAATVTGPAKDSAEKMLSGDKVSAKDACAAFKELSKEEKAKMVSGTEVGLLGALSSLGPDGQRVRLSFIAKECGSDQQCLDELATFTELLKESCTSADSCADNAVAMPLILGREPTNQQKQAGVCPGVDCATVGDIRDKVEELGIAGGVAP